MSRSAFGKSVVRMMAVEREGGRRTGGVEGQSQMNYLAEGCPGLSKVWGVSEPGWLDRPSSACTRHSATHLAMSLSKRDDDDRSNSRQYTLTLSQLSALGRMYQVQAGRGTSRARLGLKEGTISPSLPSPEHR